jgi:hypothetical protein
LLQIAVQLLLPKPTVTASHASLASQITLQGPSQLTRASWQACSELQRPSQSQPLGQFSVIAALANAARGRTGPFRRRFRDIVALDPEKLSSPRAKRPP